MALIFLETIKGALANFPLTNEFLKGKDESKVQKEVYNHLRKQGLKVTSEKQVGFLKFYVDIDFQDGGACVEIKLADKLVNDTGNTGEIQRLLGQTFYFTKNYRDIVPVVMILVIGNKELENDHRIKEIKKYIESLGAEFKYFAAKED